ncbi:uncharacterized protein LOC143583295 [Bidens hawaiensis]|uniref:uncharacterized protein LOC143583295 n=1 Tax=Bidens hawaiensis TaxID=980011 RepID=UPI00404A16DC
MTKIETETETASETVEELLMKIQKLEQDHHHLKDKILNLLMVMEDNNNSNHNSDDDDAFENYEALRKRESNNNNMILTVNHLMEESQYENILQSMAQSVYLFDVNNRIVYWNQMSQTLYGYTVEEALGKTAPDIIIEPRYSGLATLIIQRAVNGETWSGQFPVRTKYGEKFAVITTLAPCRDENETTFGVTCVCADTRQFRKSRLQSSAGAPHRIDSHQPLQSAIVSKISTLVSCISNIHILDINFSVKCFI